jgi:hypothetical protein
LSHPIQEEERALYHLGRQEILHNCRVQMFHNGGMPVNRSG